MKKLIIYILLLIPFMSQSQLIIGINVGGFSANKKTAAIYKGDVTYYDIEWYFNHNQYKPTFDNFFQYNYQVVETPLNSRYRIGIDLGLHLGVRNYSGELFLDANFAKLSVQELFTVAIDDPNNGSFEPTYEAFPVFGEEKRLNFNLGYSPDLYNEDGVIVGFPIFVQINSARLEKNYFVVDGQQYNIIHTSPSKPRVNPGGIGYGLGAGLTGTFEFNTQFSFLGGYYAQYSKVKMNEILQPWGLHHSFFARIIWAISN